MASRSRRYIELHAVVRNQPQSSTIYAQNYLRPHVLNSGLKIYRRCDTTQRLIALSVKQHGGAKLCATNVIILCTELLCLEYSFLAKVDGNHLLSGFSCDELQEPVKHRIVLRLYIYSRRLNQVGYNILFETYNKSSTH